MRKILRRLMMISAFVISSQVIAQQWTKLNSGTTQNLLGTYTVDNNVSFTCGANGTILKTSNGGTTWTSQTSGTSEALYSIFFTSSSVGYAVGDNGTALTTTNGGINWSTISLSGGPYSLRYVYFVSSTEGYILGGTSGSTGVIYRYSSGTWTLTYSSGPNTFYSFYNAASNNYLATNYNGDVYQSTNGGTTWGYLSTPTTTPLFGLTFNNSSNGYAVGDGGKIYNTSNGSSWSSVTSGTTDYLTSIKFFTSSKGFIVGGNVGANTGRILYSSNGGSSWNNNTIPSGTSRLYALSFGTGVGYAVGLDGTILKYSDCDNQYVWNALTSGVSTSILGVSAPDANTVYVCGASGLIMKSTNGGSSWSTQTSGTSQTLYSIYFTDANTGFAVGDAGVNLKTTNGGMNWNSMSLSTSNALRDVKFNGSTGYISGGTSTSSGTVYKTTDNGVNWSDMSVGANNIVYSTSFSGSTGYASASNGNVYKTTGSGWTAYSTGVSAAPGKLYFTSSTDGILVDNNGTIRRTTNSGVNWNSVTSPTSNPLTGIDKQEGDILYAVGGNVAANTPTMIYGSGTSYSAVSGLPSGIARLYGIDFVDNIGYSVGLNGTIIKTYTCLGWVPRPANSIAEATQNYKTFIAYPNPTSGSTTIDLSEHAFTKEANFELFDVAGKSVIQVNEVNKDKFTFETNTLSPGIYLFKIFDAQTAIGNGKIIVR